MNDPAVERIRCVGGVVHDERRRLLLVRRATEPGRGLWSIPGGRIQPYESDTQAVQRELREETGLTVEVGRLIGSVLRPGPRGTLYEIYDYAAQVIGGTLLAGDDAADARWVTMAEYSHLNVVPELTETLRNWSVLPE
jgi:8-oxo-dGTP diphosphatase